MGPCEGREEPGGGARGRGLAGGGSSTLWQEAWPRSRRAASETDMASSVLSNAPPPILFQNTTERTHSASFVTPPPHLGRDRVFLLPSYPPTELLIISEIAPHRGACHYPALLPESRGAGPALLFRKLPARASSR